MIDWGVLLQFTFIYLEIFLKFIYSVIKAMSICSYDSITIDTETNGLKGKIK